MTLGEILKERRDKKGFSLRQIEYKLNAKGIKYSHTNIGRLENNEFDKVPIKVLSGLAELYKLDKIHLFNLAGAALDETDERILELSKKEKMDYDKFVQGANLYFNDEGIEEEDMDKVMSALTEAYFRAKEIKREKKSEKEKNKK